MTSNQRCAWFGEGRGQCLLREGHPVPHHCEQDEKGVSSGMRSKLMEYALRYVVAQLGELAPADFIVTKVGKGIAAENAFYAAENVLRVRAPESPQPGSNDQSAFERWAQAQGLSTFIEDGEVDYNTVSARISWRAWQAATPRIETAEQATHFAFLWRRPIDSEPWAAIYTSRELAEAFKHRVSDVVHVRLRLKDRDTGEAGG